MTKTDFAELKEKLIRFDSDDITLNKMIKDENYAWAAYDKMSHIEKVEAHDALLDIANYQHTKSSAIISELIEIIQSQSEALDHVNEFCLCKRNTFGFDYHEDHPVQGLPKSGSRWLTPRDRIKSDLSETTTRLQKLRDGNNGNTTN